MDAIKVVDRDLDSGLPRNHWQVDQHVGGSAHRSMNDDGILEGLACQNTSRSDLLLDELEDLLASGTCIAQEPGQGGWNEVRTPQGQTKRLCQHLASAGAAHELAGTARR